MTQPSISAAVSALSSELGVDLTERVGRGIGLTAAGQAFRPYAADVLGLVEQGRQAAREAADSRCGACGIVAVATAAEYVVPALLRSFAGLHPEIQLSLEVANRATRLRARARARGRRRDRRPPARGRSASPGCAFLRERARPDRRARATRSRRKAGRYPRELADRVWLQREPGSGTRAARSPSSSPSTTCGRSTLTLGSNGAIKEAVRLGLGVSLQSRVAVEHELDDGHARRAQGARRPARAASGTRCTRPPSRRGRPSSSSSSSSTAPAGRRAFTEQEAA